MVLDVSLSRSLFRLSSVPVSLSMPLRPSSPPPRCPGVSVPASAVRVRCYVSPSLCLSLSVSCLCVSCLYSISHVQRGLCLPLQCMCVALSAPPVSLHLQTHGTSPASSPPKPRRLLPLVALSSMCTAFKCTAPPVAPTHEAVK